MMKRPLADRFWSKADMSAGPDECWPWTAQSVDGRGRFKVDGKVRAAHLVAYELTTGESADGLRMVRVNCENRLCVNPSHLRGLSHDQAFARRFYAKVDKSNPDGCWLWTGAKTSDGYGVLRVGQSSQYAHRLSYRWAGGDDIGGKDIDHICRNPPCVNPSHLRAASRCENLQNLGIDPTNTSGYRGVYRSGNRWVAETRINFHKHYLGLFATPEEAAAVATAFRAEHMPFSEMDKRDDDGAG